MSIRYTRFPVPDGWWRLPDRSSPTLETRPFEAIGITNWWWAYTEEGQPVAVCNTDVEVVEGMAPPNYAMGVLAEIWRRETGLSIFDHLRLGIAPIECKYNGKLLDFKVERIELKPRHEYDAHSNLYEDRIVAEAVEQLKSQMRRNLRAFPTCGYGGLVNVFGKINRSAKTIQAGLTCNCGY